MTDIQALIAAAEDLPSSDGEQSSLYLLLQVDTLLRMTPILESGLGQIRYRLFNIFTSNFRQNGTHVDDTVSYRIIRAEDLNQYKATADANYRAAYGGNVRSGEYDHTVNWANAAAFPRLY